MGSVDEADVEKAEEKERKEQWAENVSTAEQAATSEEEKQPVATPLADSSAAENGSGPAPGAENGANVRAAALKSLSRSSLDQEAGMSVLNMTEGFKESWTPHNTTVKASLEAEMHWECPELCTSSGMSGHKKWLHAAAGGRGGPRGAGGQRRRRQHCGGGGG